MKTLSCFILVVLLSIGVLAETISFAGKSFDLRTIAGQQVYATNPNSAGNYDVLFNDDGQLILAEMNNQNQVVRSQRMSSDGGTLNFDPIERGENLGVFATLYPATPPPVSGSAPPSTPASSGTSSTISGNTATVGSADATRINNELNQFANVVVYIDAGTGELKTATIPPPVQPGTTPTPPPAGAPPTAQVRPDGSVVDASGARLGTRVPQSVLPSVLRDDAEYEFVRTTEDPQLIVNRARVASVNANNEFLDANRNLQTVRRETLENIQNINSAQDALSSYEQAVRRYIQASAEFDRLSGTVGEENRFESAREELERIADEVGVARNRFVDAQTAIDPNFDELDERQLGVDESDPNFVQRLSAIRSANGERLQSIDQADARLVTAESDARARDAAAEQALRTAEQNLQNPVVLRVLPRSSVSTDRGTLVTNRVETTTEALIHSDGSVTTITSQDVLNCGIGCDDSKLDEFTLRSRSRNIDRTQDVVVKDEDNNDITVPMRFSSERSVNNIPLVGRIEEFGSSERVYWEPPTRIPPPVTDENGRVTNQEAIDRAAEQRNREIQNAYREGGIINQESHIVHKDASGTPYLVYDPETDEYYSPSDTNRENPLEGDAVEEARANANVRVDGQARKASDVLLAQARMKRNEDREAAKGRTAFGLFATGDIGGSIGRLMKIYNQWSGLTQLSNLIWDKNAKEVQERRQRMIQEFCLAGGIENCLVSAICGEVHEITPSNVIAGRGPGGQFVSSGVIVAERSFPIDIRGLSRQQLIDTLGRNITTINGVRVDLSNPGLNISRLGNITLRLYHVQASITNNVAGEKDVRYNIELRRTGARNVVETAPPNPSSGIPASMETGEVVFDTAYAEPVSQAKLFRTDIVLKPSESTPPDKRHEYFNSFAEWDVACILTNPGLPKGSALDSSFAREFCTPIIEYKGGPTEISIEAARPPAGQNASRTDVAAI